MTELLYMKEMAQLVRQARVIEVLQENDKTVLVLDQTVFYPQGGGQPYDRGKIISRDATFCVEEVRFVDGFVRHIGTFESGHFETGQEVTCQVDAERRQLMSRIHSAGHVVDMAINSLGYKWTPGKGFHFPDGPYVEYSGDLPSEDLEQLSQKIEEAANVITSQSIPTKIEFMPKEQMHEVCRFVPDYLSADKPARVVLYGDFGVPCGGTHVANLHDIGTITIRKVKPEKGNVRVSYSL